MFLWALLLSTVKYWLVYFLSLFLSFFLSLYYSVLTIALAVANLVELLLSVKEVYRRIQSLCSHVSGAFHFGRKGWIIFHIFLLGWECFSPKRSYNSVGRGVQSRNRSIDHLLWTNAVSHYENAFLILLLHTQYFILMRMHQIFLSFDS